MVPPTPTFERVMYLNLQALGDHTSASSKCPPTIGSYKKEEHNKHRANGPQNNHVPVVHCLRFPWTQKHKTTVSTWASCKGALLLSRSKDFCRVQAQIRPQVEGQAMTAPIKSYSL